MTTPAVLAVHADWSVAPRKRWMTVAARAGSAWRMTAPEPVGEPASLFARLLDRAGGAPVAFGGDFPLGLPRAYADRAGIARFPDWLGCLDPEAPLFTPCDRLAEVSLARPFFPRARASGAGLMAALADALGLDDAAALRRDVDWPTARRPGAAPLFWTLGANQCGKGGLSAWRETMIPAIRAGVPLAIWPFDGDLRALLAAGRIVVAETYPREAMVGLDLRLAGSKRRQADRRGICTALRAAMARLGVHASADLAAVAADGFGARADGEDRFDSVLGALGVIRVVDGAADGAPGDAAIRSVEGWVLGQTDPPIRPPVRPASRKAAASPPPSRPRRPRQDPRSRPAGQPRSGSG